MALTEDRLRSTHLPEAEAVDVQPPAHPATVGPTRDLASLRWSRILPIAWLIALPLSFLLEPAPSSTDPVPLWVAVTGNVLLLAIAMTFVGSWLRRPWVGRASLVGASIFAAGVIACPVTGHHAFGGWWVAELAIAVGLLAVSGAAALRPSA